ncbi:MAG: sodium:alanine symporter family protein [Clostridia bacterium]|nr:sodium:alanine symporter family protein [Clostridia bacterium]
MLFEINSALSLFLWGPPMLAVFLGTGIFLSFRSGFFQISGIRRWVGETVISAFRNRNKKCTDGSITQFSALTSALAACLGTGNIIGVATAICSGGPGALFWMCVSAIFGMMTCCCENILGIKYRIRDFSGKFRGGPMYYIENGLGMKRLACTYAFFLTAASLGMGNMTQANSVAQGMSGFGIPPAVTAVVLCVLLGFAVSGGLGRISKISEKLIPVLTAVFVAACFIIIIKNAENIIPCFKTVIKEAFTVKAVGGFGLAKAARYGISRGVFSNEAGLGSSAIIHASADCKNAGEQGMWGILEVFIDTVFMCTVTGAAILTSGVWSPEADINGAGLCAAAFESVFGRAGGYFLNACICLFAFATLTAWSYYGRCGAEYLFGEKANRFYSILYVICAFAGSLIKLESVWSLSDTFNGLMAIPNIFALLLLNKEAIGELKAPSKL